MIRNQPKCLGCGYPLAWDNKRKAYARAIGYGLSPEEANRAMPRCSKCITELLNPDRRRGLMQPYHRRLTR